MTLRATYGGRGSPLSLRIALPVTMLALALVVVGAVAIVDYRAATSRAWTQGHHDVRHSLEVIQASIETSLEAGNLVAVQEILASQASDLRTEVAFVSDPGGTVRFASDRDLIGDRIATAIGEIASTRKAARDLLREVGSATTPYVAGQSHNGIVAIYPIVFERGLSLATDRIGRIWVRWDISYDLDAARAQALRAIGELMAPIILAVLLLILVLHRVVTRRVGRLVDTAETFARGHFDVRTHLAGRDEIGLVGSAFDEMADRISQSIAERNDNARMLRQANDELESFSYSVSHDLRAPLRHIEGFVRLLRAQLGATLDPESTRYLATIAEAATRMGTMIDELLAFARSARAPLERRPVDLGQEAATLIESWRATDEGARVRFEQGDLPIVEGDPAALRQVLLNLIDNAVKYSAVRSAPRVEIGSLARGTPGLPDGSVGVYVRDNGVGFDPAYAHKLFGVFQRLHRTEDFAGSGIGLANVRRAVHRHGGQVWAEGTPDEGATFFFSLPAHNDERRAT